ncbi:MAG TPA: EamA family transporter [Pyrinomonadaceae bacterium]|jgi:transporter family protein
MNAETRPLVFSLLTILMWGLWGFFGKLALERRMAPTTVFVAETLVSALIAVPLFLVLVQRGGAQPFQSAVNVYGILSGAALAVGLLFYYLALEGAGVSVVVPLTATYPVVAALLGYAALGERPTLAQWAGVLLVIAGAALLLSGPAKVSGR